MNLLARVFLLALLLTGAARAEVAVPPLGQRVTDLPRRWMRSKHKRSKPASPHSRRRKARSLPC